MKSKRYSFIAAALLAVNALAAATITYHLASTYKFAPAPGGREYFDYITFDPGSSRLYLTHGTEVLVVNARYRRRGRQNYRPEAESRRCSGPGFGAGIHQ